MTQQGSPPNGNPYNQPPQGHYPGAQPQGQYSGMQPQGHYPGAQPQGHYPGGQPGQYPGMQPQGHYPGAQMQQAAPKNNPILIAIGALLLLIGLGAGALFLMNAYQYATVEDRWANDSRLDPIAREFGTRIVKKSAMKKMTTFGSVSGVFGVGGLVLVFLGVRKKKQA